MHLNNRIAAIVLIILVVLLILACDQSTLFMTNSEIMEAIQTSVAATATALP